LISSKSSQCIRLSVHPYLNPAAGVSTHAIGYSADYISTGHINADLELDLLIHGVVQGGSHDAPSRP